MKEPKRLPRTIPLDDLALVVGGRCQVGEGLQGCIRMRNKMIAELLIAAGIRVSELCSLDECDFDARSKSLLIKGKGSKERDREQYHSGRLPVVHCGAPCAPLRGRCHRRRRKVSFRQSVRSLALGAVGQKCCEWSRLSDRRFFARDFFYMFRRMFATIALEDDVDIRRIQTQLCRSSLKAMQIYTYVSSSKLRDHAV